MTSALLETASECDVAGLARCVVLAVANDRKGHGRPHRLGDEQAVCALLTALRAGSSVTAAARSAGFSAGAVRLCVKRGALPGAPPPEAALVAAVAALRAAQDPVRLAAVRAQREAQTAAEAAAVLARAERQAWAAAQAERILL